MQFIASPPVFKLVRITGPQHNILILKLSEKRLETPPTIEDFYLKSLSHEKDHLPKKAVFEQVMRGIKQASLEVHHDYFVEEIQYVSSDSKPVEIYKYLAEEIIRRVHQAEFKSL